ncbi:hypothetical protein RJ639_019849 [Escallonia herrerae]|uniref:Coronatine-insensitive protein 1 n=1 Tax=Escallonia herrerae TaxID=1293975 RepID=A0AA89AGU2_9ASTE|nr:hypothetical protein RJ639_019849 [Escallonia herrerae]
MADPHRNVNRIHTRMPDTVLECVTPYIQDSRDRGAISLVCKRWYQVDALTRKHVTVALCYATTPRQLLRRFAYIESLKLKGKPRMAMFSLLPDDWGGYLTPWAEEIARSFPCLKELHFRRMIVQDTDLELIARSRGRVLQGVKLDNCSGFSTDGLLHITRLCRNLKTLFLEDSTIIEKDSEWLHELALHSRELEELNFYMTDLSKVRCQDLELIAKNCCPFLRSLKVSDCDILDLVGFFRTATSLKEFGGGTYYSEPENYSVLAISQRLCSLGPTYLGKNEMPIMFPFASLLKNLDLLYALLDTEDHCHLIQRCPNLEVLQTRDVIADRGLEVLAHCCKQLRSLRIERGADEQGLNAEHGAVTHRGLIALAHGCPELNYLAVYVTDITNASLECIGTHCKNLSDFRLVLLDPEERITDLPLDSGVQSLLIGCPKIKRFALYLRPGGLTNVGLSYIGLYSKQVKWMLLGFVGESDEGLVELSRGCPRLEKLELRGCCFSEHALATAVSQLTSLRYIWVQGCQATLRGLDLLVMTRQFLNIELITSLGDVVSDPIGKVVQSPLQIFAYYSLAGQRTDCPDSIIPLHQNSPPPS